MCLILWSDSDILKYNCILVLKAFALKMNTRVAEACRWPQYNKSTPIKLKYICWSLINFMHLINVHNMEHVKLIGIYINNLHILNRNERSLSVYEDPKPVMWESLVHIRLSIIIPRTIQKKNLDWICPASRTGTFYSFNLVLH